MNNPNRNRTKKLCFRFDNIPREIINGELFRPTQIMVGPRPVPHVFGNCTWISDPIFKNISFCQIVFASSDEQKVMRIIRKYGGSIVPIRKELNQWQIEETNLSGKTFNVELANETICK